MLKRILPLLLLVPMAVQAQSRTEDAILYRQGAYKMVVWNFAPMGAMVRGASEFDAEEFSRRAARVAALAPMLLEGFPAGSDNSHGVPTDALEAVWSNWSDFSERMAGFEREAAALAEAARGGDRSAINRQFGVTAQVCRDCHDRYRAK